MVRKTHIRQSWSIPKWIDDLPAFLFEVKSDRFSDRGFRLFNRGSGGNTARQIGNIRRIIIRFRFFR